MASLYAYQGLVPLNHLYNIYPQWFERRCGEVLKHTFHLQCHSALWREKFVRPSWVVYDTFSFFTTHGGSRLLVAFLRGDSHIRANVLCQFNTPPFPDMEEFDSLDTNCNILTWEDFDPNFTKWAHDRITFEHGIKIKSGSINHTLIDQRPLQVLQGHYIPVTRNLLKKVSDWNKDKVYWSHGNN